MLSGDIRGTPLRVGFKQKKTAGPKALPTIGNKNPTLGQLLLPANPSVLD